MKFFLATFLALLYVTNCFKPKKNGLLDLDLKNKNVFSDQGNLISIGSNCSITKRKIVDKEYDFDGKVENWGKKCIGSVLSAHYANSKIFLVSRYNDETKLNVIDTEEGKTIYKIRLNDDANKTALVYDGSYYYLFTGNDNNVKQWSVSGSYGTPQLMKEYNLNFKVKELKLSKNSVYALSNIGSTVQIDASSSTMKILNTTSLGSSDSYYAFSVSPDNTLLYYATKTGIKVYDISKQKLVFQEDNIHGYNWHTENLFVSPNGKYLINYANGPDESYATTYLLLDTEKKQLIKEYTEVPSLKGNSICMTKDNRIAFIGGQSSRGLLKLQIYNLEQIDEVKGGFEDEDVAVLLAID